MQMQSNIKYVKSYKEIELLLKVYELKHPAGTPYIYTFTL